MAAKTAKMLNNFEVSVKNERLLMNKLRDSGLEYISSSGKVIAAKTQPGSYSLLRDISLEKEDL